MMKNLFKNFISYYLTSNSILPSFLCKLLRIWDVELGDYKYLKNNKWQKREISPNTFQIEIAILKVASLLFLTVTVFELLKLFRAVG